MTYSKLKLYINSEESTNKICVKMLDDDLDHDKVIELGKLFV